jgi:hypothetical protein
VLADFDLTQNVAALGRIFEQFPQRWPAGARPAIMPAAAPVPAAARQPAL